jgi:hypothetical protein
MRNSFFEREGRGRSLPSPRARQHDANRTPLQSASIAANSFCTARTDGIPSLSLRSMVAAYSSRIAAYCLARSGSEVSASSTIRESRAFKVPFACQGNSISISPGTLFRSLLLIAIMGSLVPRRLPQQFGQFPACIEPAHLHGFLRNTDDPCHLFQDSHGVDRPTIARRSTVSAVKHVRNASQHLHGEPAGWRDRSGHDYRPTACAALNGRLAGLVGLRWQAVRSGTQDFSEHIGFRHTSQKPFRAAHRWRLAEKYQLTVS